MSNDFTHGRHDVPMFQAVAEGSSDGATVEIARVIPAAEKITAGELRLTDRLFDTTGGTHALKSVRQKRGWVDTVREDGWPDRFHHADVITVLR